ncbi:hypothetical protein GPECTOR_78g82 [Gonium pectorale]|uniref:Uncharacterized protein n=1 Tax=Gonium pectorale TaxID=33097 RepID=A0A150G252_GONPE|nr:hypothetical protein GPECTOR_78g82 [Gonium pectorale]|eukprot:KXZ43894.1 hypothetical protein GPECTOR_78g82 [Gonium pectorale]
MPQRDETEALHTYHSAELRVSYRPGDRAWGAVLFSGTASDSSAEANNEHEEEHFEAKEYQYLDASSDEYQEPVHEAALLHALTATTATGIAVPQEAMFHRRPRKQLRPVACSC